MEEKISKIWFNADRIYLRTATGNEYSRPLEAFPRLKEANEADRYDFAIGRWGDDVRWEKLDEDIHISSFFEQKEPDQNNEIADIFNHFPQLDVSEVTRSIGISKSLLSKYIYGIKKPSEKRKNQIKNAIHALGRELIAV